jgi:hypothetical protein
MHGFQRGVPEQQGRVTGLRNLPEQRRKFRVFGDEFWKSERLNLEGVIHDPDHDTTNNL